MFCSYLSQFSTVLAKNWTVGKFAGIRTLTRTRTRRYPYPKPAGVAKPLQFPTLAIPRTSTGRFSRAVTAARPQMPPIPIPKRAESKELGKCLNKTCSKFEDCNEDEIKDKRPFS